LEKLGEGTYATVYKVCSVLAIPDVFSLLMHPLVINKLLVVYKTGQTARVGVTTHIPGPIPHYCRDCRVEGDPPGCGGGNAEYGDPRDQLDEGYVLSLFLTGIP
jgi:hypothetical protein